MGSNGQYLVGDSFIHLLTWSSVTGLKVLKAGGTDSGASLKEPKVGKFPDFADFIGEERRKHVYKAFF